MSGFLPVTKKEMTLLGWNAPDFVVVTGDAYVDHPSFGVAIISRILEDAGYNVCVLSQPQWKNNEDFKRFGKPKLGFMITAGNIDSMVAHYTAAKKKRSDDAYSPGGKAGKRPDRACIVYTHLAKQAYPDVPVILGGLEASLRRFAHYDYWDDEVKPSILIESGADILSYGMSERQTLQIAGRLKNGEDLKGIRGTCFAVKTTEYTAGKAAECPSFENVRNSKKEYAKASAIQQNEQDHISGKTVIQRHGDRILIQTPPEIPLSREEFDHTYELPYMRYYHPIYEPMGGVPAIEEVEFSITHNRGCFGACAFCSIAFHQGRYVTARSKESLVNEAKGFVRNPRFKGYIHDVGGPTANFRRPSCEKQEKSGLCRGGKRCLAPKPCPALIVDHSEYLEILRDLRRIKGIKKVFIRSGIRFDYLNEERDPAFFRELIENHVSGQLKVAPEHCRDFVLDCMGKPHIESYNKFAAQFYKLTEKAGKKQFLVPYLMSSHPGSKLNDAVEMAVYLKNEKIRPEQVQDFYPTPGTISTSMFYTGLDPYTLKEVYIPKATEDKALQRTLLQYYKPENRHKIRKALKIAGRNDLIGFSQKCLVPPDNQNKSADKHVSKRINNKGKKR